MVHKGRVREEALLDKHCKLPHHKDVARVQNQHEKNEKAPFPHPSPQKQQVRMKVVDKDDGEHGAQVQHHGAE